MRLNGYAYWECKAICNGIKDCGAFQHSNEECSLDLNGKAKMGSKAIIDKEYTCAVKKGNPDTDLEQVFKKYGGKCKGDETLFKNDVTKRVWNKDQATLEACLAICNADGDCLSADWNDGTKICKYTFKSENYADNMPKTADSSMDNQCYIKINGYT